MRKAGGLSAQQNGMDSLRDGEATRVVTVQPQTPAVAVAGQSPHRTGRRLAPARCIVKGGRTGLGGASQISIVFHRLPAW